MGGTVFLTKANTLQELTTAAVDVVKHNETAATPLGGTYSNEEFAGSTVGICEPCKPRLNRFRPRRSEETQNLHSKI